LAINPPSDIVLDVAKAADPLQYTAAVEKLARIGEPEAADSSFDLLLGSIEPDLGSSVEQAPDWTRADLRAQLQSLTGAPPGKSSAGPYRQFEAFVLQTFVQSMLPKDASDVFGKGIAGSYWSSMLAEQIAGQVAKSGGIGIAEEIAARHPAASPDISIDAAPPVHRALFDGRPGGVYPFDAAPTDGQS